MEQLYSRLFLGDLAAETFLRTSDGWQVAYLDDTPDSSVALTFDFANGAMRLRTRWRGADGPETVKFNASWNDMLQVFWMGISPAWSERDARRLQGLFNATLLSGPARSVGLPATSVAFLPDGTFRSISFPLPVSQLRALLDFVGGLQANPAIKGPVTAYASVVQSYAFYVKGGAPSDLDERSIARYTTATLGLPVAASPYWQVGEDGSQVLTVLRQHYNATLQCTFRDTERVLDALFGVGLLASRGRALQPWPCGPEYAATILDVGSGNGARIGFQEEGCHLEYPQLFHPEAEAWATRSIVGVPPEAVRSRALARIREAESAAAEVNEV
ncbi:MAG: hypothetical protein IPK85_06830 [Gemmatimonadetes bacterium]|nr:hypothetical protein [Gemmatimonadota bacterium]